MIPNDVKKNYTIFGLDLAGVRGKVTRKSPLRVELEYVNIPWEFTENSKMVTLLMDIMFVNQTPFVIMYGR